MLKHKDKRTLNRSIDILRIVILSVLFGVFILMFLFKLFDLQVLKTEYYSSIAVPKTYRTQTLEMSRGQIYDRNGNLLVSNKKIYNISIDKTTIDSDDYNTVLLSFIEFCSKNSIELVDNLPVSNVYPYTLDEEYIFDDTKVKMLKKFAKNNELEESEFISDKSALYDYLCDRYGVDETQKKQSRYRKLVGIRYDMETSDFDYLARYDIVKDIDEKTRTLVSEQLHSMHGISITTEDERYYNQGALASHILGRTSPIYAEETEEYVVGKGYDYDAVIGREGAEKAFEDYLHGFDGRLSVEIDSDNNVLGKSVTDTGRNGYSVKLTLDAGMQKAAEDALKEQIELARELGNDTVPENGEDCKYGSVVVMQPKTGDVLVCANYPNYDLNNYSEIFNSLVNDETRPLVNRATQGIYPPGSTFKIASAIAALCSGTITENTLVNAVGVYRKHEDYQPHCWIYDNTGGSHGYVNVKSAIEHSCNYFFYKVGDDMGIDTLTHYASLLGLGKETGIEVPESTGILASPEYRDSKGLLWNPGDTLQAAIGQSDNAFTPLQLCSYMCAVVNGGTRYKATLLESVENYYTKETVFENKPEILSKISIPSDVVNVLKSAMKSVVVDGTARTVFDDYDYEVGGKTGTAQVAKGSDTALFVGFAPYDDPEIVVSVVVENGDKSTRASSVAKAVFDYYFDSLEGDTQASDE